MLTYQSVHHHLALLTDSVRSVHRLQIHLRVEIGIVDDHRIRRGKVDTQPSSSSGQQENRLGGVRTGEVSNLVISTLDLRITINSTKLVPPVITIILQNVEHHSELTKY